MGFMKSERNFDQKNRNKNEKNRNENHQNINSNRKDSVFSLLCFLACLLFYAFFSILDGAVICVDSPTYIYMDISREPVYPMLLAVLRSLFSPQGGDLYLTIVCWLQGILAAFAAWFFMRVLQRELQLSKGISACLLCLPLMVSLLCRFAAKRSSMYSNSILTEGLAVPLFLVFIALLFVYTIRPSAKELVLCVLVSILLVSIRKQMFLTVPLLGLSVCYVYFLRKKLWKGVAAAIVLSGVIMLAGTGIDVGYNQIYRGEAIRHSSDTRFLTTMAFYTGNREDAQYFENDEIRDLYVTIYDACDNMGYLKKSAGKGWLNRVSHFGDVYDRIQIDTMWPMITAYAMEHAGDENVSLYADSIMDKINLTILPHNIGTILATFGDNFLSGLVTTVAQRNRILIWYSILIYLVYVVLFLWAVYRKRDKKVILFGAITILSILGNVALTSLVIFCQTRYMIYNMPLFYGSLLLLLLEAIKYYCHVKEGKAVKTDGKVAKTDGDMVK